MPLYIKKISFILFKLLQNSYFKLPRIKCTSYTKTKSGQILKPPLYYNASINKDI